MTEDRSISPTMPPLTESSSSTSGGLACAIANFAERQQMSRESSGNYNGNMTIPNTFCSCSRFPNRAEQETECYLPPGSRLAMTRDEREWGVDHGSEVAEAGTSCANSEYGGGVVALPPQQGIEGGNFQDPLVPESFEEQMMLAMVVSLADTCAMTSAP
ncbi:RING/U-box superfamily protein [Actinidia rufa]|uniref:RING/U-box superfamily protein n=1 Tax=Actinidia rufa TaxID=165716 RepID=A0A7J0G9Z1_9ERIC|nr:RING/U-box superfamily protein [Actinidia rufa]